jgi:hypothetical protein
MGRSGEKKRGRKTIEGQIFIFLVANNRDMNGKVHVRQASINPAHHQDVSAR